MNAWDQFSSFYLIIVYIRSGRAAADFTSDISHNQCYQIMNYNFVLDFSFFVLFTLHIVNLGYHYYCSQIFVHHRSWSSIDSLFLSFISYLSWFNSHCFCLLEFCTYWIISCTFVYIYFYTVCILLIYYV